MLQFARSVIRARDRKGAPLKRSGAQHRSEAQPCLARSAGGRRRPNKRLYRSTGTYRIEIIRSGNTTNCEFQIDDFTVTYNDNVNHTVCITQGDYRFGSGGGGQEKDNEIYGEGNSYTAQFWQYDPRLGRRWNIDPKTMPDLSPYSVFENNPIVLNDVKGDCTDCDDEEATVYYSIDGNTIIAVVQSSTIYATFEFTVSEALRNKYNQEALKYVESTLENSIARKNLKIQYRNLTPPAMRSWLNKVRPLSGEKPPAAGRSPGKTNPRFNKIAGNVGKIGKGLLVVGISYSIYEIATAEDPVEETVVQGGIWAGAIAGGYVGAEIGGFGTGIAAGPEAAPAGAIVGGIVGSVVGGIVGEKAVNEFVDRAKNFEIIDTDALVKDLEENHYAQDQIK